jgi:formylglycine-generating enzyme
MHRQSGTKAILLAIVLLLAARAAGAADVFNLPQRLTSLEFVTVGDPGNAADTRFVTPGYGKVDYTYQIGKYDVTAGQYCEFLNAVAATDTYGLYNPSMDTANEQFGCNINRSGSEGSYQYSVAADWANRPVNFVSWGDAARFCNWLGNGQPTGLQGSNTTEDGSYSIIGATSQSDLMSVARKENAHYVLPTENEWYKAAYYDPGKLSGAGYWTFATRSDTKPVNTLLHPDPGNHANYFDGENHKSTISSPYWRTEVGAFTNSFSAYGTFDQNGNVWQWNEAIVTVSTRGYRGGAFDQLWGNMASGTRGFGSPALEELSDIGFRITSVPEPNIFLMVLMGATVVLIWRRHRNV